ARAQDTNSATAAAPARPVELTALDYFQIQQLVAKYAEYIDTCSNNGYDYADLFAEDGFFAPFQNGQLGRKAPEGAKGQVNMLMIGLGGDKNKIEHDGYYEDTYVKTLAGWKFKSRIHHATYDPAQ